MSSAPSTRPAVSPSGPPVARNEPSEARGRLLHAALALFAAQGFAKTSTREIAQAAGTNIAAIAYYFGDKAGLYAATFDEPLGGTSADLVALLDAGDGGMSQTLRRFFDAYVAPLRLGDVARQCMRLHLRELIEPSGHRTGEALEELRGPHEAMVRMLGRHLGLVEEGAADDELHRLALAIVGMAIQLFVMQDIVDALRPGLLGSPAAIDAWAARLHDQAMALIDAEAARRRTAAASR